MYIDIHRHSSNKGKADIMIRNLFPQETDKIPNIGYCSVGLHPWEVNEGISQYQINTIKEAASSHNVIAIGETGIDKFIKTNPELQKRLFLEHMDIAISVAKPIIIHCVRAYDTFQFLRKTTKHDKPWIFHWYNASYETGIDLIKKGCYLSFGHLLFVERSKACKTFIKAPLDKVFFETDDVDIAIVDIYKQAAKLKGISLEHLQNQIKTNFFNCFGIEL